MKNRIILIGMSGVGKTYYGLKLAQILKYDFYDLDELVSKTLGKKIEDIFTENGENFFRNLESNILFDYLKYNNCVISTGGGIVEREKNREILKYENKVIFLNSSIEYLESNLINDLNVRPKLNYEKLKDSILNIYAKRIKLYREISNFEIFIDSFNENMVLSYLKEYSL